MGMGIVLSAALCSALADVYLEKMFKETKTISFWLRNASALTKDILSTLPTKPRLSTNCNLFVALLGTAACVWC